MRLIDADRLCEKLSKNLEDFEMLTSYKGRGIALGTSMAIDRVDEQPTIDPKPQWIPVTERLPEKDGFYLATCDGGFCGEDEPFSGLAEFENGKWLDDEEDHQCVLAWMPLPKPYKPDGNKMEDQE